MSRALLETPAQRSLTRRIERKRSELAAMLQRFDIHALDPASRRLLIEIRRAAR